MLVEEFDYPLPKELIAQKPLKNRDESRLMVLRGDEIIHAVFSQIDEFLERGDLLVVNNSRVIPARLRGRKSTGGRVELLLLQGEDTEWECLVKGRVKEGTELQFGSLRARVLEKKGMEVKVKFSAPVVLQILEKIGEMPTPPYIKEKLEEPERYQTIFAKKPGSVAAPTAGFHFSETLLKKLGDKGIEMAEITLHVGAGTFLPVKVKRVEEHKMHEEFFTVEAEQAEKINRALEEGRGVIAVGTTTIRTLESCTQEGRVVPGSGKTDLFIYPGYKFKLNYKGLITNFHLPKSTLLMLVCAFAGKERIFKAYEEAIKRRYRFYSFGDAMLIMR